ncbi:MAG: EamA family transporter, partial [Haloarculaceae archaeon]
SPRKSGAMGSHIVALALLAAAGWGAGSPLSKLGMERGGTPNQVALTVLTISATSYWTALVVRGEAVFEHAAWVVGLFVVTGLFATAMARVLTFEGVDRLGSSVNSAGVNTRPVWATVMAVVLLGESVTLQMTAGIVVVVGGLVVLAFSEGGDISGWETRHLLFPLTAAVAFGAGSVARRFAFTASAVTPLEGAAINETAGLVGMLAYVAVRNGSLGGVREALRAPRRSYAFFAGSGAVNALALLALFEALSRGRVVVVDPLSSPTSLFAIVFTAIFLRKVERVTRRVVVGAALVVTGVVLITGPQLLAL